MIFWEFQWCPTGVPSFTWGQLVFASGTTCLVVTLKMSHVGSQLDLKVAQNIDKTAARYNMA